MCSMSVVRLLNDPGVIHLAVALIIFQLLVIPTANKLVVGQVLSIPLAKIALSLAIPFLLLLIPLILLKMLFLHVTIDTFLVRESIVGLVTLLVSFLCFKYISFIRDGLLRLKKG